MSSTGRHPPPARLSHPARAERRRAIAAAVAGGMSMDEAATRWGVSNKTVRDACKEGGVRVTPASRPFAILADLFDPGRTMDEIARARGISQPSVSDIYRRAREAGIPVPERTWWTERRRRRAARATS